MLYLADNNNVIGFYDSELGPVPSNNVELSQEDYKQLWLASSKGATISLENGKAVAKDYQGNVVDIANIKDNDSFSKPIQPPSNKDKAEILLNGWIQDKANLAKVMNKSFGPKMIAYVETIENIINGSQDEIPEQPSDIYS